MKKSNYEKCKYRYNNIMLDLCYEHLTIGTSLTEEPEKKNKWNIRDMVAEAYYLLTCYTEPGHTNYEDRLYDEESYKCWRSEKGKLERFIKAFEAEALNLTTTFEHSSEFLYGKYAA